MAEREANYQKTSEIKDLTLNRRQLLREALDLGAGIFSAASIYQSTKTHSLNSQIDLYQKALHQGIVNRYPEEIDQKNRSQIALLKDAHKRSFLKAIGLVALSGVGLFVGNSVQEYPNS